MNLDSYEDLIHFQESSATVLAATSDVSFYYSYFTEHYYINEIEKLYSFRDKISNWKSVFEQFLRDNDKFAKFFYENPYKERFCPEEFIPPLLGNELERLGCEIASVFRSFYISVNTSSVVETINKLHEAVAKFREKNPRIGESKAVAIL